MQLRHSREQQDPLGVVDLYQRFQLQQRLRVRGLCPETDLIAMAKESPELLLVENAHGKTPMDLIPLLIADLQCVLDEPYLKCAEDGWARSNIRVLENIKTEWMEVLDEYAN